MELITNFKDWTWTKCVSARSVFLRGFAMNNDQILNVLIVLRKVCMYL